MNYIVLLGGNIGDRLSFLANARKQIARQCGDITKKSSIYETAAWGVTDQANFYNQVITVCSQIPPVDFLRTLLVIEKDLGRVRFKKWGERVIDLDILFIDDLEIKDKELLIPHPRLHERRFTLVPLLDIANDFIHPTLNKTIAELLDSCPDNLEVSLVTSST